MALEDQQQSLHYEFAPDDPDGLDDPIVHSPLSPQRDIGRGESGDDPFGFDDPLVVDDIANPPGAAVAEWGFPAAQPARAPADNQAAPGPGDNHAAIGDNNEFALLPDDAADDLMLAIARGAQNQQVQLQYAENNLVPNALILARDAEHGAVVQLGHRHSQHVFYKVLKTNLSARFVQQDDGRRAMRIAVVKLTLVSKDGDKGVFQSNFEHQQLDLWELLQHVGMVLPNLFIKGFRLIENSSCCFSLPLRLSKLGTVSEVGYAGAVL